MDLARAPRRAPLTARKKGSGYENVAKNENSRLRTLVNSPTSSPGFSLLFFVCNHVTFHPNDGQSNNLWTIFLTIRIVVVRKTER